MKLIEQKRFLKIDPNVAQLIVNSNGNNIATLECGEDIVVGDILKINETNKLVKTESDVDNDTINYRLNREDFLYRSVPFRTTTANMFSKEHNRQLNSDSELTDITNAFFYNSSLSVSNGVSWVRVNQRNGMQIANWANLSLLNLPPFFLGKDIVRADYSNKAVSFNVIETDPTGMEIVNISASTPYYSTGNYSLASQCSVAMSDTQGVYALTSGGNLYFFIINYNRATRTVTSFGETKVKNVKLLDMCKLENDVVGVLMASSSQLYFNIYRITNSGTVYLQENIINKSFGNGKIIPLKDNKVMLLCRYFSNLSACIFDVDTVNGSTRSSLVEVASLLGFMGGQTADLYNNVQMKRFSDKIEVIINGDYNNAYSGGMGNFLEIDLDGNIEYKFAISFGEELRADNLTDTYVDTFGYNWNKKGELYAYTAKLSTSGATTYRYVKVDRNAISSTSESYLVHALEAGNTGDSIKVLLPDIHLLV